MVPAEDELDADEVSGWPALKAAAAEPSRTGTGKPKAASMPSAATTPTKFSVAPSKPMTGADMQTSTDGTYAARILTRFRTLAELSGSDLDHSPTT